MNRHSFEEVSRLDDALHQLAIYEVTQGRIVVPQSYEEMIELQGKFANKFNEFKSLIKRGECTYEFIKWHVLDKNGPFSPHKENEDLTIIPWEEVEAKWSEEDKTAKESGKNFLNTIMDSLLDKNDPQDPFQISIERIEEKPKEESKPIPPKITLESLKHNTLKKKKKQPKK
jgi:hypothetical protein